MGLIGQLERLVHDEMERWSVPGLSIGILHGGEIDFSGFGICNIETGQPVAPETLFQIGSISKIFTTTLVMNLVDEGLLSLDEPVCIYVPELSLADAFAQNTVTLRHLLTHMAGFYGDRFDDHGNSDNALALAVGAFRDLPQQTALGELWTYCNAGFDLAGRAVERVTGQSFERAMRERVFEPLGLERTTYFAHEAIRHSVSVGHLEGGEDGVRVANPWPIPRRSNPAGGVISNAAELIRFAVCHARDGSIGAVSVLTPESATSMRTFQTIADYGRRWGLGWQLRDLNGLQLVEHTGATCGFMARLAVVPKRETVIAVLTNGENGAVVHTAIYERLLETLFGFRNALPEPAQLSRDQLSRFEGHFRHGLADLIVESNGSGLTLHRTTHDPFSGESTVRPPARLSTISETLFIVEDGAYVGATGELIFDGDGQVRFLRTGGRLAYPIGNSENAGRHPAPE
jgi:CubicO group peptidase (beta-lactamase class C family)